MLQFLIDVPDHAFTDEGLRFVAARLRKTPNLATMRDLLQQYIQSLQPPAEHEAPTSKLRREEAERHAFLRRDWDDPVGIAARIRTCAGDMRYLRVLALAVGKWAPQHIGLLPPNVLQSLADDPEITLPVINEIRARGLFARPQPRDRQQQLDAVQTPRPRVMPNYLDPEYLDRINPLPHGRKRTDASTSALSQQQVPDGGRATTTEAMAGDEGRYPARDE